MSSFRDLLLVCKGLLQEWSWFTCILTTSVSDYEICLIDDRVVRHHMNHICLWPDRHRPDSSTIFYCHVSHIPMFSSCWSAGRWLIWIRKLKGVPQTWEGFPYLFFTINQGPSTQSVCVCVCVYVCVCNVDTCFIGNQILHASWWQACVSRRWHAIVARNANLKSDTTWQVHGESI